ncbi:alpha-amylase family glycosyl hydrolase [Chromohalobacter israelensis]|uniref:alpha-amylase family glycosyl hydrolase n=1 Tax=Chromohalobacter israelensis TaxID=141390 RepID=UPI0005584D2D|nr:alpha-amylase family glycosyl hydrolase [Chromohalobacter israelensis]MDF9434199.1 alpha-amylase family glycosyl hydrolase [Chromohalobacter israelensis]
MTVTANGIGGHGQDWWRGAVIYQIYPRSFMDASGDGIGDLQGVIERLDYIAALGVDAIWLSPFFTSPMKDFGYDVSDYRGVDPMFGTLADFDRLVEAAHARGLKVTIDQVLSHTSDQHPWFLESRDSRDNPRADWYVWADPRPDGSPPTNWQSIFGGSAWQWDTRRCQYYLHNFLVEQPDLNFRNPRVVEAILGEVRFWLERGVDGFRLDAVNFCTHGELKDNPPREELAEGFIGVRPDNPYGFQRHIYDKTQPENLDFLEKLRALLDEYPGTTSVGEVGDDDSLAVMAEYTQGGKRLHMAYSFDLLGERHDAAFLHRTLTAMEARIGDGWPCWALGNHDVTRLATRWDAEGDPAALRLYLAFLLTQRGSVCLYQGEELGLGEAQLAFEQLVDPAGITFWPAYKGRDGCRTPQPWQAKAPHAGFSPAAPWLPVPAAHQALAVDRQEADPDSLLHAYRDFLTFRRSQPALIKGDIRYHPVRNGVLCLERRLPGGGERLLIALNFTAQPRELGAPHSATAIASAPAWVEGRWADGTLSLPAHGIAIGHCADDEETAPWDV